MAKRREGEISELDVLLPKGNADDGETKEESDKAIAKEIFPA